MRKSILYIGSAVLCASMLCSCSNSTPKEEKPAVSEQSTSQEMSFTAEELIGTWNGSGYAIAQGENYDASFLSFTVEDDLSYTIKDTSSNETLIKGSVTQKENQNPILTIKDIQADNIAGWTTITVKNNIKCQMLNKDMVALTYDDICYIFENSDSSLSDYSLLDYTVSDLWYSNDGSQKDDFTYELSFNDKSFQLYEIKGKSTSNMMTSFIYQKNDGDSYTFYTFRAKDQEFPPFFSSIPEGFSSVTFTMSVKDNEMVLTTQDGSATFYSNLIYGLETGSDSYTLCDTSFIWAFDDEKHFCYFTMNPDTDTLYLYMCDAETTDQATSTVCGEVKLDQENKIMTYHFDQDASDETSAQDDAIYQKCKDLDGQEMKYEINDKVLSLTIDGKDYNFNLSDY